MSIERDHKRTARNEVPTEVSSPLRFPAIVVEALLSAAAAFGRQDRETGGFLLVDDHDAVRTLALAGEAGVERGWGRFMVSGEVVEQVCEWAAERHLRVAALVHTHRGRARMSKTDRNHGFRVEGFRSVIIPSFIDPPAALTDWGWYVFEHGDWHLDQPGQLTTGTNTTARSARVIFVDEGGVR